MDFSRRAAVRPALGAGRGGDPERGRADMTPTPSDGWHYEFIKGCEGHGFWRVADQNNDYIRVFATEAEARDFVRAYNKLLVLRPKSWRY